MLRLAIHVCCCCWDATTVRDGSIILEEDETPMTPVGMRLADRKIALEKDVDADMINVFYDLILEAFSKK